MIHYALRYPTVSINQPMRISISSISNFFWKFEYRDERITQIRVVDTTGGLNRLEEWGKSMTCDVAVKREEG